MRSHKREMSYVLLNMARALYIPHDLWSEQQCIYGNTSKLTSKYIEHCTTKLLANITNLQITWTAQIVLTLHLIN